MRRILTDREGTIVILLTLLIIAFWMINPAFLSPENIGAIIRSTAYIGIVAVGMSICLISGSIDLSVGGIAGMSAVIMAHLIVKQHVSWPIAVCVGILSGIVVGIINWTLIEKAKITAFIATIGTLYLTKGIATYISNAYSVYPLPKWMGEIASASPLGASMAFFVFIGLVILFEFAIRNTVWGLQLRASGSDREVAYCTEVNVNLVTLSAFFVTGILSAISGILLSWKLIAAQPMAGTGWELLAITACAIGGVSLFGYDGSMFGVFLGVLTMQVIVNGMVVIGLSPHLQQGVTGLILLMSMAIDMYRRNKWILLERVKNE